MATDVFDVFDREGQHSHDEPPPPRFQGIKTAFAVTLALLVLGALGLGSYAAVRSIASGASEAMVCSPTELAEQQVVASWLRSRSSQATGTTDSLISTVGCTEATATEPIGAVAHLVDDDELQGALVTLSDYSCEIELADDDTGSCEVEFDGAVGVVTIKPAPADDPNGNYLLTVGVKRETTAG